MKYASIKAFLTELYSAVTGDKRGQPTQLAVDSNGNAWVRTKII